MEIEAKKYEIAYVLSPTILEEEVSAYANKIALAIEDTKGMIKYVEEPKKIRLAYPINKERNAYFGWTVFTVARDGIKAIDKKVKELKDVSRFLIVEKDAKEVSIKPIRFIPSKSEHAPAKHTEVSADTPEEKLDLEALDKKLEEILGSGDIIV